VAADANFLELRKFFIFILIIVVKKDPKFTAIIGIPL